MRKAAMFLLTAAAVMILPRIIVADDARKPARLAQSNKGLLPPVNRRFPPRPTAVRHSVAASRRGGQAPRLQSALRQDGQKQGRQAHARGVHRRDEAFAQGHDGEHARPMGPPPVAIPLGGPMPGPGNVMWIQRPMPGPGGVGGPGFAPAGPGGPGGPAAGSGPQPAALADR